LHPFRVNIFLHVVAAAIVPWPPAVFQVWYACGLVYVTSHRRNDGIKPMSRRTAEFPVSTAENSGTIIHSVRQADRETGVRSFAFVRKG
jgi:hypothetical protein